MNEKTLTLDGHKIRYLEEGNSEKILLLIHGLGASAERWNLVLSKFAKNYHVIIPDLIGFGYSDKPMVDYTIDYFSDFISNFVKKLDIDHLSIIGSSLGGQIAAEFACQNNSKVEKLVLISPSGIMKHTTPALDAYIMAALYPNSDSALHAFEMMSGNKNIDENTVNGFVERMKLPKAKMAFMSTLLGLKDAKIPPSKLSSILSPSLIVWGENDPVIPIKYAQSFVSGINDCRFVKMLDCGHTPFVERPDEFYAIVSDFLE